MSSFKTVLVRDSVIGDVTDDIDYAVKSGAAQSTYQSFPTTSASNSALIFSIQCPSENVIIGRDVLINTGLTATINVGSQTVVAKQVPVGEWLGNTEPPMLSTHSLSNLYLALPQPKSTTLRFPLTPKMFCLLFFV